MARPREFDIDEALAQAIDVFWRQGYEATSVQDLVDATGLKRGSLYAAFGSKAGLFAAAMERYMEGTPVRRILENAGERPVRQVLRELFDELVAHGAGDRSRRGCLITNTAIELSPHNPEVAAKIADNLHDLEDRLADLLARGQERGEIDSARDPRALARYLVSSIQGLRVMSKIVPERRALEDIAETTLANLD